MSRHVNVLLVAGALAAVAAVVAVAVVVLTSDTSPPAPVATPPEATQEGAAAVSPPSLPPPRTHQPVPAPAPAEPGAEPAAGELSQEAKARAQAAKLVAMSQAAQQDAVATVVHNRLVQDFDLTPEQEAAADAVVVRMRELTPLFSDLLQRHRAVTDDVRRQARENAWTPEQEQQMCDDARRRFVLDHQGEFLDYIDGTIRALENLRPHVTDEQAARIDRQISRLGTARDSVLQGSLKGL